MLPKSVAFALVNQAATSFTTKENRRSSTSPASGSDDDESPLLPNHTRTRKATNRKDLRAIKRDSESKQGIDDDLNTTSLASQKRSRRVSVSNGSSVSDEVEFVHFVRHRPKAPMSSLFSTAVSARRMKWMILVQAHVADSYTPFSGRSAAQSGSGRLRDVCLVDWTPSRTRTIGGKWRELKKGDSGCGHDKSKGRYRPKDSLAPQQDPAQTQNWAMMFKPVLER